MLSPQLVIKLVALRFSISFLILYQKWKILISALCSTYSLNAWYARAASSIWNISSTIFMISSTPLPFISLVIDIPLTVFLALPFSNKYTAGLCHSGSSLLNACHASTSFFQAQQSSSSSRLKIRGNLILLIFMEINKLNNPSQLIYITVNQFGGNTLENNKTN